MSSLLNNSYTFDSNNLSVISNYSNSLNSTIEDDSYTPDIWVKVLWSCLFGLLVIIAFLGNSGVILIVLLNSIADIMVSSMNVIFNFVYMLNGHWFFGNLYCKISNFIAILSVSCSCWTLMAISIDRFIAIVYPLKPRMSYMTALNTTIMIWFSGSLLSLPNFIFSMTTKDKLPGGEIRITCFIKWPDGAAGAGSSLDYYYNLAVLILTYFLPITLMSLTYFRVATVLWGSNIIGEQQSSKQAQSIKSKRKIVKMMVLVLCSFSVLWLPYHLYFLIQHHMPEITHVKYAQHIYLTLYFLAMSTSMLNPPIYCWLNSRFRRGFLKFFCCEYCKSNSSLDESDARKNYLRTCQMGYLKKHNQWPSSSEPQSTSESTAQKFKCSSSASSQYYANSSHSGREVFNHDKLQVLAVHPINNQTNRNENKSNSLFNIQQHQQQINQIESASLKNNSDQLMLVLNDHKSPIKICIPVSSDSKELNNNIIVHLKELNNSTDNMKTNEKSNRQFSQAKISNKKFAIASKQIKSLPTSQSYSSVCLKNSNFDSIEMLEPSSSCSSVYSRNFRAGKNTDQVDQV